MTRRLASFMLPVALAGAAAFLAARLAEEARMLGQAAAVETGPVDGERHAVAPENEVAPPEDASLHSFRLSEVLDRPLFSPTRRPPVTVAVEPAPPAALTTSVPDLQLNGIVMVGDARMALLRDEVDAALLHIRAGDRIGDWRVLEIGADEIVLQSGNETHRIRLDYRNGTQ